MSRFCFDCPECGAPEGWCSCSDGIWIPEKANDDEKKNEDFFCQQVDEIDRSFIRFTTEEK
jgi:hypothetical protein